MEKLTTPYPKEVWRIYDNETGKAMADYITIRGESVETANGITLFDPVETWKARTFTGCSAKKLLVPVFAEGKKVYTSPSIEQIRSFCAAQVATLWDEVTRFENPHRYYVDLSRRLWDERQRLLKEMSQ